jgi:glycosyltransferase involved in cell wall biosynthesis
MVKTKVLFVSNICILNPKGGWDGLGHKVYNQLLDQYDVQLLDQINPRLGKIEKAYNKLRELFHLSTNFYFFSSTRLAKIKNEITKNLNQECEIIFFHGATPWVDFITSVKYFVLLDCTFEDYIKIYHDQKKFNQRDLNRIIELERQFLLKAEKVFVTSEFSKEHILKSYKITVENVVNVQQGPDIYGDFIEIQNSIVVNNFLFIASDFYGKGGELIYAAFKEVVKNNSNYFLTIVGERPPSYILRDQNIIYKGYIDKSKKSGLTELKKLYNTSKALVLLSKKDVAPLVIIEAGYFGCPSIAFGVSAVPEMIINYENGILIEDEYSMQNLIKALKFIIDLQPDDEKKLRKNTQYSFVSRYNWSLTRSKMLGEINGCITK